MVERNRGAMQLRDSHDNRTPLQHPARKLYFSRVYNLGELTVGADFTGRVAYYTLARN